MNSRKNRVSEKDVEKLDKVLVLKDGELEYFGTNKECLANSPTYKRMVELQTLESELEG